MTVEICAPAAIGRLLRTESLPEISAIPATRHAILELAGDQNGMGLWGL